MDFDDFLGEEEEEEDLVGRGAVCSLVFAGNEFNRCKYHRVLISFAGKVPCCSTVDLPII